MSHIVGEVRINESCPLQVIDYGEAQISLDMAIEMSEGDTLYDSDESGATAREDGVRTDKTKCGGEGHVFIVVSWRWAAVVAWRGRRMQCVTRSVVIRSCLRLAIEYPVFNV